MKNYIFFIILSCVTSCLARDPQPFSELTTLRQNESFCYEQYQLPSRLRSLLTVMDVIMYERGVTADDQLSAIDDLLSHYVLPANVNYVARSYAPETYKTLDEMCNRLGMNSPLLFIASRGEGINGADICFFGGKYYGLVLGSAFLRSRTLKECRAVVSYKLAQVARRDCEKERINGYVWPGVLAGSGLFGLSILVGMSLKRGNLTPFTDQAGRIREKAESWALTGAVLGLSWIISTATCAHLSRKYARQADRQALVAFDGDPTEYADCLYRAHADEQRAHEQEYEIHKGYHEYVRTKLEGLGAYGMKPEVIEYLEQHLQECRRARRRMQNSSPLYNLFSKKPSFEGRIEHVRSLALKAQKDDQQLQKNNKK